MALPDTVRTFLVGLHFATIATIDPDGRPRQAVIWYLLDGDELLINSRVGRRWPTNLLRDPRISVSVMDETDPLRWVGLNGTVEVAAEGDAAQLDIAEMARKYEEPTEAEQSIRAFQRMERITFRVRFDALHDHLD
jgi:PPOX class probable F420-dependent enzyme